MKVRVVLLILCLSAVSASAKDVENILKTYNRMVEHQGDCISLLKGARGDIEHQLAHDLATAASEATNWVSSLIAFSQINSTLSVEDRVKIRPIIKTYLETAKGGFQGVEAACTEVISFSKSAGAVSEAESLRKDIRHLRDAKWHLYLVRWLPT